MADRNLETPFECVDPKIGEEILRLEDPDLDSGLRHQLEAHLSVCHACRLLLNLDAGTRELARKGGLEHPKPPSLGRRRRTRRVQVAWAAGLALAACLAVIVLSPPRPVSDGLSERGVDLIRFLSPVEGEVISTTQPNLRWTPIVGATRYFVEIRDSDGTSLWESGSPDPSIRVPEDASLARGRTYKAILSARPADLVEPGRTSVVFRTDSLLQMVLHRLRWTHPILQWIASLSAVLTLLMIVRRFRP